MLLNADVEIRNKNWLTVLVNQHKKGITACDKRSDEDNRPDGWCYLIDTELYGKYKLDDVHFHVWCSLAKLTSQIVNAGYSAQTIVSYENFIHHFGSASGPFKVTGDAPAQDHEELLKLTWDRKCELVNSLVVPPEKQIPLSPLFYVYDRVRKLNKRLERMLQSNLFCK